MARCKIEWCGVERAPGVILCETHKAEWGTRPERGQDALDAWIAAKNAASPFVAAPALPAAAALPAIGSRWTHANLSGVSTVTSVDPKAWVWLADSNGGRWRSGATYWPEGWRPYEAPTAAPKSDPRAAAVAAVERAVAGCPPGLDARAYRLALIAWTERGDAWTEGTDRDMPRVIAKVTRLCSEGVCEAYTRAIASFTAPRVERKGRWTGGVDKSKAPATTRATFEWSGWRR